MNIIESISHAFRSFLVETFSLPASQLNNEIVSLNTAEDKQQFGDLTSNAALTLAKQIQKNPRIIGQTIAENFHHPFIASIEVAGPGFLNITLTQKGFDLLACELFTAQTSFFKPSIHSEIYNIEFVSANPTGPLHFGHGRGGVIGDVLGNTLSFCGHTVTKEFYINDAGAQMKKLGISLKIRYEQCAGMKTTLPEDGYHGAYLIDLANELHSEHKATLLDQPLEFFISFAKTKLLEHIKETLHDYGISFDVWFSEKALHDSEAIEQAFAILKKGGYLYEKEGALWFQSTLFGDDKDRVLKKQSGELTYASPDIAYMQNKVNRGHKHLIYILGHDHHSYATRLQGMLIALGLDTISLDVILYQLVKIKEGSDQVKMSKRKGTIVTLQDVIDTVGKDVARFFYLHRKADAQLEFDLELACKHTDENPVYYIQYAFVRTGSILENAATHPSLTNITVKDLCTLSQEDSFLIKKIVALKDTLLAINNTYQTHLLTYYTHELAQAFNRYYNKNRVIELSDIKQSRTRLGIIIIMRNTLGLCLKLMGLSRPERM